MAVADISDLTPATPQSNSDAGLAYKEFNELKTAIKGSFTGFTTTGTSVCTKTGTELDAAHDNVATSAQLAGAAFTGLITSTTGVTLTGGVFTGNLTGTASLATTSANVTVLSPSATNTYVALVDATGAEEVRLTTPLTYNVSTDTLTCPNVTGDVTGNLTGNADTVTLTPDNTNADYDVGFVPVAGGTSAVYTATQDDFKYNPNTSTLTLGNLSLATALPVAEGGTGASSAGAALTALGAAALGANSDITSLTGITSASFTPSIGTGWSGTPAHTFEYVKIGNLVLVYEKGSSALTAAASDGTWTYTGWPEAIQPTTSAVVTSLFPAKAQIDGLIAPMYLSIDASGNATGWTGPTAAYLSTSFMSSGTKGLVDGTCFWYSIDN